MLVSTSDDACVCLWSVASGACLHVLDGHIDEIYYIVFFNNGKQLASSSLDETARIWTLCKWSDRTHYLFGPELKAAVFSLMCIRAKLEKERINSIPRLPMEIWLLIFEIFNYSVSENN